MKLIFLILMLVSIQLIAQDPDYRNSVYLEAGGTGYVYSINYDHSFILSKNFKLATRAGFATWFKNEPYILPFELTGLLGNSKDYFEFGLGYTLTNDNNFLSYRLGYRREVKRNLFRAAILYFPEFTWHDGQGYPWVGLSYGYRFNFKNTH